MFPQLPAAVRVLRPTRSTSFSTVAMRPRRPQMHVVAVVLSAGRRPGRGARVSDAGSAGSGARSLGHLDV